MPKLRIDTKKSLYKPIEVEIDGKVFQVRRLTRDVLQEAERLDSEVASGKLDAAYERLEFLLQTKNKIFNKLSVEEVGEVTRFITSSMLSPEKSEKNESRPEDEKSPK
jgi:hypothetical protein